MSEPGLPPVPPGIDLKADQGPRIIASMTALMVLPTIFVILRLLSRKIARAGYWWDDALVVIALVFSYGYCIGAMISEQKSQFGRHVWALDDPAKYTTIFLKILYVCIICYLVAVTSIKLALQPIHGFWNRHIPSKCISGDDFMTISGAINTVLDFFIVALPLPLLWKLRTTNSQKGVLTGIFACAGFVCIISIIRLVVLSRNTQFDVTWNYVNVSIWSAAEPSMSVIAACMPSLRPLISCLIRGTTRASDTLRSKSAHNASGSNTMFSKRDKQGDEVDLVPGGGKNGFARLGIEERASNILRWDGGAKSRRWRHDVEVKGGREKRTTGFPGLGTRAREEDMSMEDIVPQGGIQVKSEVLVTVSDWEWKDWIF